MIYLILRTLLINLNLEVLYLSDVVKKVISMTEKKTVAFARRMALRKVQFTDVKSSSQRVRNIRAGNANVPTNVFRPLDSVSDTKLNLKDTITFLYDSST